jgi:hypothetical protein
MNDEAMVPEVMLVAGGGELERASLHAGPGFAVLASDRGVCGIVRYDEEHGVSYDDCAEVTL